MVLIDGPFTKQRHGWVFMAEISGQGLFKGSAEEHGGPGVLLLPAVEITVAVPARAAKVVANLGIAVDHQATSDPGRSVSATGESSLQSAADAKPPRLRTESPWTVAWLTFTTP